MISEGMQVLIEVGLVVLGIVVVMAIQWRLFKEAEGDVEKKRLSQRKSSWTDAFRE